MLDESIYVYLCASHTSFTCLDAVSGENKSNMCDTFRYAISPLDGRVVGDAKMAA